MFPFLLLNLFFLFFYHTPFFSFFAYLIPNAKSFSEQHSEKLAKHEVLKMCEGVGKILLREPDEVISMFPAKAKGEKGSGATDDGNLFYFHIFSLLLLYIQPLLPKKTLCVLFIWHSRP